MTTKKTTAPTHPAPDSKGAKRKTSAAAPNKPDFLAELQSLSVDELIQQAKTLDATATSAWMPRALTLGELVARERLSELPGRQRTTRLRELASQTRIGLKTVRQDLRIGEVFFADKAKAANWLAREPVSREAFVTALVHPPAIEQAYDACVRGEYDRAAFRRYVKRHRRRRPPARRRRRKTKAQRRSASAGSRRKCAGPSRSCSPASPGSARQPSC